MLDEDDLNEFQNSVPGGMAMAATPDYYQLIAQYATVRSSPFDVFLLLGFC